MISFVETELFTRLVREYLSDDGCSKLQQRLLSDPEAGAVIPGSGGVRELRWGVSGRGKRGGLRVIDFLSTRQGQIRMLTRYAKNEAESISAHVLQQIEDEIDG